MPVRVTGVKKLRQELEDYPSWICYECGKKYGTWKEGHLATFHRDTCGWCGRRTDCCEPRDYKYPPSPETLGLNVVAKKERKK